MSSAAARAFKEARPGVLLIVLWCVWGLAFVMGEKLPENDGLGWDGWRFGKMVEGGPAMLAAREINGYYVQRVGPSFAVRALLQSIGATFDAANIRAGFIVLNLTLLSIALYLLMDAARRMSFSAAARWILFLGLFINPANGRLPVYYAPIGDSTAFFIGALVVWGYIARRMSAVVAAFLLAVVCWPAAFLLLPLLMWPRPRVESETVLALPPTLRRNAMIAALPLGLALLAILSVSVQMMDATTWSTASALSLATNALLLGAAAAFALAFAWMAPRRVFTRPGWAGLVAAAALITISAMYVRSFESGSLAFGADTFGREMILFARSGVFASLIGHAAYYAALAIAAAVVWPEILRRGLQMGTGAFIGLSFTGLIALDAESRRLNAFWPLVGVFAAMALSTMLERRKAFATFVAAALILSKIWWPLTGPLLFEAAHQPGNYFNLQGPSMSAQAVLAHALAALAFGFWVWFVSRVSAAEESNAEPSTSTE